MENAEGKMRYKIRRKSGRRNASPEFHLQVQVVSWLRLQYPQCLFTISPASIQNPRYAKKMKLMGYRRGTPDLLILEPRGEFKGLFVELKYNKAGRNEEQILFRDMLNQRGYAAVECVGYDCAQKTIELYLKGQYWQTADHCSRAGYC